MIPQEFKNIEKLLVSFLGESKNGMSENGQMQFPCPKCIDEKGQKEALKFNLEVNLFKQVYKCWSCSSVDGSMEGRLSTLFKKYSTLSIYNAYKEELDSLIKSKLYDIGEFVDIKPDEEYVTLPKGFTKINLEHCNNINVLNYLSKRKITQAIIDRYNIGYTSWVSDDIGNSNRIIIPSYDSFGDLNYWVGRDYTGKSKNKYKNCTADKKNIIFQESLVDFDADIILCEGAIDCLYPPNAISMLGKSLTRDSYLYKTLVKKANANIYVCLDSDTKVSETKRICRILGCGRLRGKVGYLLTHPYKDIGEVYENEGNDGMIKIIRDRRRFTELDLVFE